LLPWLKRSKKKKRKTSSRPLLALFFWLASSVRCRDEP
jgi:hypothetical protein